MPKPTEQTLVVIPTYNEIDNIEPITRRVREAHDVDILIVDDNSPDGTGERADELAAEHDNIHVIHRKVKDGLLGAYLAGFQWGLEKDYEVFVELDADGSHAPEQLGRLLAEIDNDADMVIGSRYIDGGEVSDWPLNRYLLSRLGNLYIGLTLGTGLKDMTAGYRAIRREVLETVKFEELSQAGYIFQVEFAFRAVEAGFDVREVPITFVERRHGESKLDGSFVADSLSEVTKWGLQHRTAQLNDFATQMVRLGRQSLETSSISDLGKKMEVGGEQLGHFFTETRRILGHELSKAPWRKGLEQVRFLGFSRRELGKEKSGPAKSEAGRR